MTDVRAIIARAIADEHYREDAVTLDDAFAGRILRALREAGIKPLAREPTEAMIRMSSFMEQDVFRAMWDAEP